MATENTITLVTFLVPLAPAFVALLLGFGRYDGYFKDATVFMNLLLGLAIGALTSLLAVSLEVAAPILFVTGMPLALVLVMTSVLNRRRFQGERHAVFNGASMGTGVGIVWCFAFGWRLLTEHGVTLLNVVGITLFSTGFVLVVFSAGAFLGSGVADRTPFRVALLAGLAGIAPFSLLAEYVETLTVLWPALLAVVGVAAFAYARARLLPLGIPPEARQELRRKARRAKSDG